MDLGYGVYCLADPRFYDTLTRARDDDVDFEVARRPVPAGWRRREFDDWLAYSPETIALRPQGWKIHVSADLDGAAETLEIVSDYCFERLISFKFVRSLQLLLLRNAKYADRGASGKFVAIFPTDDGQFETILDELGARLAGRRGPYILSDLRIGDGPLYVRYGGFAERYCIGASGEPQLAIADPTGTLVPDHRGPTFQPPPWVALPNCLVPHLEARNQTTIEGLPYRIDRALHFSNGGGVYAGVDRRTDEPVVLKEARPFAGLAMDGADAVARLEREQSILERLGGLGVAPAVRDCFTLGEHMFLVEDFVEGTPLSDMLVDRHPLTAQESTPDALASYTRWALEIDERVERAVAAIHERGIVIRDLHPHNVLVRPDGDVVLIDFEVAGDMDDRRRQSMADPAFLAPAGRTGVDLDQYALACLRLFLFLPLTSLLAIDQAKAEDLAGHIAELFPVPAEFLNEAIDVIAGRTSRRGTRSAPAPVKRPELTGTADSWPALRDSLAGGIVASATLDRHDRLFPGDVSQFSIGGLNLSVGAAGVLYALEATGSGYPPEHIDWLVRRATDPEPGTRLGFYDGLFGVAYTLDRLGRTSEARKVLDICLDELPSRWERLGDDLFGGLSGVGLALAHLSETLGEPSLASKAREIAAVVASRLGGEADVAETSGGDHPYAGLLRGSSGPALLFVRLYEQTGEVALLDVARTALRQDLRRCYRRDDGSLEVNEGWRTMPYLAEGSIGIGMVLHDYLQLRADEELADAAAMIRRAAEAQFYIEPGLVHGRAGMILYLSRMRDAGPPATDSIEAAHIRRLAWHAMSFAEHLAFPGEELLRLSMDLSTGSAGILLALGASLDDQSIGLPFLGPRRVGQPTTTGKEVSTSGHS